MTSFREAYASIDHADVASVIADGIFYRCYVYVDVELDEVHAVIFAEQEQGQDVLVSHNVVGVGGGSTTVEDPKVVAIQNRFIVGLWETGGGTESLHLTYLDMTTIHTTSTWTLIKSLTSLDAERLWDIFAISTTDYVIAYRDGNDVNIHRYNLVSATAVWSALAGDVPENVLAVYGNDADNVVCATYEESGTSTLRTHRVDADGTNGAQANTFTAMPAGHFSQVGHTRISATVIAVVAEVQFASYLTPTTDDNDVRAVAYRKILAATAAQSDNEHYAHNLCLLSRPWSYADDTIDGSVPNVYCVVGHKSVMYNAAYAQQVAHVVNLLQQDWDEADGTVRPMPVANINLGDVDCRHGDIPHENGGGSFTDARRNNHISHVSGAPQVGPDKKTQTVALLVWSRYSTEYTKHGIGSGYTSVTGVVGSMVVPVESKVAGYRFYPEDFETYHRDSTDPAEPASNKRFANPRRQFQNVKAGSGLWISGGTPGIYDGLHVTENGFCWRPEFRTGITETAVNGHVPDGDYQYTAIYTWRDNQGQKHRSHPADPLYVRYDSGPTRATLYVRSLNMTMRDWYANTPQSFVDIEIYRTIKDGTVFYRVHGQPDDNVLPSITTDFPEGDLEDTPKNDTTAAWVSFFDARIDGVLIHNEQLPWQIVGGAWLPLPPFQPPALGPCAMWKNSIFAASTEDPRMLWYSHELLPEQGGREYTAPEWSPVLVYRLDEGGDITGLHAMDHALVVFKRDSIFVLEGTPADSNGQGATLAHRTIAVGTGCLEPNSVVLGPPGVFFQAEKGIYLLSRTHELDYISAGAPVEDIIKNAGNIRGADLMEDRHEIRFTLNEDVDSLYRVVVYNYLWKQWTLIAMPQGHSDTWRAALCGSTTWRGHDGEQAHVVLAQSAVFVERDTSDANEFRDDKHDGNQSIPISVQTSWIHMSELGERYRVRSIVIDIEKPDSTAFEADLEYDLEGDYDGSLSDTFTWASPAPKALRIMPQEQKLGSFRLKLYEDPSVAQTENVALNGILLEVAKLRGHRRVPDANVGT